MEESVKGAAAETADTGPDPEEAPGGSEREILDQLLRRLRELEARLEAAQRRTKGIAHDVRNLLTVISGHVDLALGHPAAEPELRADLEATARAVQQTNALVQLLRDDVSSSARPPAPIVMSVALVAACDLLKRVLGKGMELRTASRATRPIWIDPIDFERIVVNLVLNARDAMPDGGVVWVEADDAIITPDLAQRVPSIAPGAYSVLRVRDSGVGMPPQVRERLFRPFFSTKKQGKGTGLGLMTVDSLVARLGGWVDVQSSPGAGTTFEVYFPVEGRKASPEQPAPSPGSCPAVPPLAEKASSRFPALEALQGDAGHIAIGWVAERVLFASFHGHLSCDLSDAYVARLQQLLAGRIQTRYFVDSSPLESFELAARTATIRSLATVASSLSSTLVLKWSGGESPSGRTILQELSAVLRTTSSRAEFEAELRTALGTGNPPAPARGS